MKAKTRWEKFEIDGLEVRVEGKYQRGFKDYFDQAECQWFPGDPDDVIDLCVYLTRTVNGQLEKLEITDWLTQKQLLQLEIDFYEFCKRDDEE